MRLGDSGSVPFGDDGKSAEDNTVTRNEKMKRGKTRKEDDEDDDGEAKVVDPDTVVEFLKDTDDWRAQSEEEEEGDKSSSDDNSNDDENALESQEASDEELAYEDKVAADIEDVVEEAGIQDDHYDVDMETGIKPIVQEVPVEEDPPVDPEEEWYYEDMERREYQLAELLQCSLYHKTAEEVRESKARNRIQQLNFVF